MKNGISIFSKIEITYFSFRWISIDFKLFILKFFSLKIKRKCHDGDGPLGYHFISHPFVITSIHLPCEPDLFLDSLTFS
jgi:hypothetical protein